LFHYGLSPSSDYVTEHFELLNYNNTYDNLEKFYIEYLDPIDKSSIYNCIWCSRDYYFGKLKLPERVYLTLCHIGEPAHFTDITKIHNYLFPTRFKPENSIHSTLSNDRHKKGFVFVGMKGFYALKKWGFKKPDPYFDTVKKIVEKAYNKNKRPVHYNYILSKLCRIRKVYNPSSIQAAIYANKYIKQVSRELFVPVSESDNIGELNEDFIDEALREFEQDLSNS